VLRTIDEYSKFALVSKAEVLALALQLYRLQGGLSGISDKRFGKALDFLGIADRRARYFSEYDGVGIAIACAYEVLPKGPLDARDYCRSRYIGFSGVPGFERIKPGMTSDFYATSLTPEQRQQWAKAPATLRQIIGKYAPRNHSEKLVRGKERLPEFFGVTKDAPLDMIQHVQIVEVCKGLTADPDATLVEVFLRSCDRRRFSAAFPTLSPEDALAVGYALEFFKLPLALPDFARLKSLYKRAAIELHPDQNLKRDTTAVFQQNAYEFDVLKTKLFANA
jgi:hypothetical protein